MARSGPLMIVFLVMVPMILICQAGTSQTGYQLTVSKDGIDYNEQVKVDVRTNSETFHLQEAASGKDAGDIVYDFKRNLTMIRMPEKNACFLSDSIGNVPSPTQLLQLLKLMSRNAAVKLTPPTGPKLKTIGKLSDRSGLSKEMADICVNLPIYRVTEADESQSDTVEEMNDAVKDTASVQVSAKRAKRDRQWVCNLVCNTACSLKCSGWSCSWVCRPVCRRVCKWIDKVLG